MRASCTVVLVFIVAGLLTLLQGCAGGGEGEDIPPAPTVVPTPAPPTLPPTQAPIPAPHGIPGWDSYQVKDFCNGTCPSRRGEPKYGQFVFPAITTDSDGRIYLIMAKSLTYDKFASPELAAFSPSGEKLWTLTDKLAPHSQGAYRLQIVGDALYVLTQWSGSENRSQHIVKVSLSGSALWSREIRQPNNPSYLVGMPTIADDTLFTLATDESYGSTVYAMSLESGKALWNYTDGYTRFGSLQIGGNQDPLQIGGKQAVDGNYLCMPSEAGHASNLGVVCLGSDGRKTHSASVISSQYAQYNLIADGLRYYVRRGDKSYYHKIANQIYDLAHNYDKEPDKSAWTKDFPDDINFLGGISRTSGGALVVVTAPDCRGVQSGIGCRPWSLIAFEEASGKTRWNVTMPGVGIHTPEAGTACPWPCGYGPWRPSFPFGASNGMVFASSVKSLHADTKTYDMWLSAIDKDGKLLWKLPIANVGDNGFYNNPVTYAVSTAGNFHLISDGVLYKVPAKHSGTAYV